VLQLRKKSSNLKNQPKGEKLVQHLSTSTGKKKTTQKTPHACCLGGRIGDRTRILTIEEKGKGYFHKEAFVKYLSLPRKSTVEKIGQTSAS